MILLRPVLIVVVVVGVASLTCATDAGANEPLRAADRAFNSNSIDEASRLYNQALADARAQGDAVAAAEILNDLSALEEVLNNIDKARSLRDSASTEKRAVAAASSTGRASLTPPSMGDLLINGGFEDGLMPPWGTGHYESRFGIWWNSQRASETNPARAYMKIDTDVRHSGERSLRITNFSKAESGVFTTTAQRVYGLEPDSVYRVSMYVKARDLSPSAVGFAIDAGWNMRLPKLPGGTYDWRLYTADINIGHNAYIDFRIIDEDTGTVWLDDIRIEKLKEGTGDPRQEAQAAFDRGSYGKALEIVEDLKRRNIDKLDVQVWAHRLAVEINAALGRYDKALDDFEWLRQNKASNLTIDIAVGDIYAARGEREKAIEQYSQAAERVRPRPGTQGDQGMLAIVAEKLAGVHVVVAREAKQQRNDVALVRSLEQADGAIAEAVFIFGHINNEHGKLTAWRTSAEIALLKGDAATAERLAAEALKSVGKLKDPILESSLRLIHGQALERKGQLQPALAEYDVAGVLLENGYDALGSLPAETVIAYVTQFRRVYHAYLALAYDLGQQDPAAVADLRKKSFQKAQWVSLSTAALSLAQMAARIASAGTALADQLRELQDLEMRQRTRERALSETAGLREELRDAAIVKQMEDLRREIEQLAERRAEVKRRLDREFPAYASLASPKPLSIADVQLLLRDGEALVPFLDMPEMELKPEETFIWVITKTNSRWVKSDLGTKGLRDGVAALRCGLDYDGSWGAPGSRCAELLKTTYSAADSRSGKLLPFDINRSYELYEALFGQIEDAIKDRHLLIVPSGALTQLPFQVLITEKPDHGLSGLEALRHVKWLIRSHALTILPSVSSLRALRQLAKDSHANHILIGFGDPLLDGPDPNYGASAKAARERQSCAQLAVQQVASLEGERRGVLPLKLRGGMADVVQIRLQVPLPETAEELCAVARDLRVSDDDIRLGARATETEIKRLSQAGSLSKYRMVHFATHGALAGQVSGDSEPGLLLTPPAQATETDDGYLSASEIAALKLDADWVILSACNTAAGRAEGAEALSGLARAFFYAGARALLVSHWSVYSDTTVKLITGAVGRIAADAKVGRAEATRQSMLALIDGGATYEVHPAYWAPFVVVGEGAARPR
jgi:CHAT domain-containing protein/tetratricopeptide (TPR) repeat protein